ncbi:MAG: cell surface protein SprA, partial [Bacteroidota bacterium]
IGNINGFKSIRFLRLFLTGFQQPVILRLANFQMVANQWRTFRFDLADRSLSLPPEPDISNFVVTSVGIEENGSQDPPYVLPPGVIRDRDVSTINNRLINEQSMQLDVQDLKNRDARAVFRNYNLDLLSYKRLRMFIHAEGENIRDREATAFVRLGTDFTDNYYEIEVPLNITPQGSISPEAVWPSENEIDVAFNDLTGVKTERNREGLNVQLPFQRLVGRYRISVVGNPDLSAVQVIMVGIRNPDLDQFRALASEQGLAAPDLPLEDRLPKSIRIWVNELRITDFDQTAGWSGVARTSIQLADVAQINASVNYTTFGFGGINEKISQRARETTLGYDISANVNVDKFFPQNLGLKIPMFVSYEKRRVQPRFNPLDPDVELNTSLDNLPADVSREGFRRITEEEFVRKSISFQNVQKTRTNPEAKINVWDIENFALSFAYTTERSRDIFIADFLSNSWRAGITYNFSKERKFIEPFKKVGFLKSPWLALIRDFNFNLIPNQFNISGDLDRTFRRTTYRGADLTDDGQIPIFQKKFLFNRNYGLQWNLSKSLSFDYKAGAQAVIDEPLGQIDTQEERDSIFSNLRNLGRLKNFTQQLNFTYTIPIDKIPLLDWVNSSATYGTNYQWTAGAIAPRPGTLGQADTLGNLLSNGRNQGLQVGFDLSKLYKKSKYLSKVSSSGSRPQGRNQPPPPTSEAVADSSGKKKNRLGDAKWLQAIVRPLLMVKKLNFTYSLTEQTVFPGFTPTPRFLGLDRDFDAPGVGFALFGSQSTDIKRRAIENDWVAPSPFQNRPFTQSLNQTISANAELEPLSDFKITVDFNVSRQVNYQENFRFDSTRSEVQTFNPNRVGGYSISYFSLRTAFSRDNDQNESEIFSEFVKNRFIILERLREITPGIIPD